MWCVAVIKRALSYTEIKVSYDIKRIKSHAKSYAFHRNTGFTIGSVFCLAKITVFFIGLLPLTVKLIMNVPYVAV